METFNLFKSESISNAVNRSALKQSAMWLFWCSIVHFRILREEFKNKCFTLTGNLCTYKVKVYKCKLKCYQH